MSTSSVRHNACTTAGSAETRPATSTRQVESGQPAALRSARFARRPCGLAWSRRRPAIPRCWTSTRGISGDRRFPSRHGPARAGDRGRSHACQGIRQLRASPARAGRARARHRPRPARARARLRRRGPAAGRSLVLPRRARAARGARGGGRAGRGAARARGALPNFDLAGVCDVVERDRPDDAAVLRRLAAVLGSDERLELTSPATAAP